MSWGGKIKQKRNQLRKQQLQLKKKVEGENRHKWPGTVNEKCQEALCHSDSLSCFYFSTSGAGAGPLRLLWNTETNRPKAENPIKQAFQKVNFSLKVAQWARLNTSNHLWKLHYLNAKELQDRVSAPLEVKNIFWQFLMGLPGPSNTKTNRNQREFGSYGNHNMGPFKLKRRKKHCSHVVDFLKWYWEHSWNPWCTGEAVLSHRASCTDVNIPSSGEKPGGQRKQSRSLLEELTMRKRGTWRGDEQVLVREGVGAGNQGPVVLYLTSRERCATFGGVVK